MNTRCGLMILASLAISGLSGCGGLPPAVPSGVAASVPAKAAPAEGPAQVRLLALNDFHGALRTPSVGIVDETGKMIRAGGAAHLATAIRSHSLAPSQTLVVGAGDLIGATPLISSLFGDEPAIETLSAVGLQVTSVGNHEFDRGWQDLLRHQNGDCPTSASGKASCPAGTYQGAKFQYLAGNVQVTATGKTLLPGYTIRELDNVKVAIIGAVLEGTPTIVSAKALQGLRFLDEATAINNLVADIRRTHSVEAIVVLIHEGGRSSGHYNDKSCPDFTGPIVEIAQKLDRAVDVIVSGHSHQAYACKVNGKWVTSASSNGRVLTQIDLAIDRKSGDVIRADVENRIVATDRYPADAAIEAAIAEYAKRSAPLENRVVGRVAGEIPMMPSASGEMPMGSLIADAQLAATRSAGAELAFMNRGGVRAPLLATRADGAITFADVFTAQPFANMLTTMDLTGAEILSLLEQQWQPDPSAPLRILQVSHNVQYAWDGLAPLGSRVVRGSVLIDGKGLEPSRTYRVTCNSFIAEGAEFFTVFRAGRNRVVGMVDVDALEQYIARNSPVAAPVLGRIRKVG
jgi:5'-nucleotidase